MVPGASSGEEERSSRRRRTVSDYLAVSVLDDVKQRRPFHEIVEVEVHVVVLGQGIEVGQVQVEQVGGRHAPDRGHDGRSNQPAATTRVASEEEEEDSKVVWVAVLADAIVFL